MLKFVYEFVDIKHLCTLWHWALWRFAVPGPSFLKHLLFARKQRSLCLNLNNAMR